MTRRTFYDVQNDPAVEVYVAGNNLAVWTGHTHTVFVSGSGAGVKLAASRSQGTLLSHHPV